MVVTAITVLITGFLVQNFARSRTDLNQISAGIIDTIREAQSDALSGLVVRGTYRCGYGVHFDAAGYLIYAGPDSAVFDCSVQDRNYNAGTDIIVRQALLANPAVEIVLPATDIFYEPPDPTTFIGGNSAPGTSATITIRRKGAHCPSTDCRIMYVSTSGRVQLQ